MPKHQHSYCYSCQLHMSTTHKSEENGTLAFEASVKCTEEDLDTPHVTLDQRVITLIFAALCPLIYCSMIISYNIFMPMLFNCGNIDIEWAYPFSILALVGYTLMRSNLHLFYCDSFKRLHLTRWHTIFVFVFALLFPFLVYHLLPFLMIGYLMFNVVVIATFLNPETMITDWMVGVCALVLVCVALFSCCCLKGRQKST